MYNETKGGFKMKKDCTLDCAACTCACTGKSGHKCETCNNCSSTDKHSKQGM
ncbi:hypothetical protein SCHRY_v1c09900 [Spiroplasma chrysopicola DF-1]|uniref:Uncharacterized protein n=1 Tax=Spiroplasma chrysopicola DF-1 TaxID=1276227 RepID=R4U2G3_9MOLU|nr:hypothetical protein SCHRY_v1c09900 [Spiroplasma chrysopicola DF-1]